MNLKTPRLNLRLISESDLLNIHQLHELPETDIYNTLGLPKNLGETEAIVKDWVSKNKSSPQRNFIFKIELIDTNQFLGLTAINLGRSKFKSAEIWYKLHSGFWGNGYATEAVNLIVDFGFKTLNLHRIEAGCAVNNLASIRVLEKVGMIKEGRKRKVLPLKDGWSDNFEYAILATDKY